MMANPRHIGIIREECEAILGKDAILSQHYLKYEDFRKLPYTLACINETSESDPRTWKILLVCHSRVLV